MIGGQHVAHGGCSGAAAFRRPVALRVWGSKGKGAALPLASDREEGERSDVRQPVCLPSVVPAPFRAGTSAVSR
jgi:hypothetical protein